MDLPEFWARIAARDSYPDGADQELLRRIQDYSADPLAVGLVKAVLPLLQREGELIFGDLEQAPLIIHAVSLPVAGGELSLSATLVKPLEEGTQDVAKSIGKDAVGMLVMFVQDMPHTGVVLARNSAIVKCQAEDCGTPRGAPSILSLNSYRELQGERACIRV